MRRGGREPTLESLAKKNAQLEKEVHVARRASEITSELVVEQFVKLEEMLQKLEKNIDTEQTLRQTLAEKLVEVERREREVAEARAAADTANRAKSTFLANMSHELRTPLNAIIGYSEMLQEEAEDAGLEDFIPDLQKILTSGRHLLNLINEILDLSKIEAGKMELFLESFEVNGLVSGVVSTAEPLVKKKSNTLDVTCPEDIGTMHADVTKVRQCLFNLLSNASKFTENGTISFVVEKKTEEGQDTIFFHVTDTGIGMTEEQMGKLFQAFQQADSSTTRNFGGTGLGLAISRRFCQMMSGDITVASELGVGTTFTIQLPMQVKEKKVETSGEVKSVRSSGTPVSPEATTILAIDDDAGFIELLQRILGKEGYRVISALGAKEGLELARSFQPDVITLDVMMPGVDGWAVLSDLKSNSKTADIPVVMVTMVDDDGIGKALGVAEHLTKPVERDRLLGILKKLCPKKAESILIVEDDDNTREMMWRTLEKEGFKVREAENGRVGIKQVAKQTPQLVLLDIMMPEMDGFEFLLELRRHEEWRNIPVVVVTAKDLNETEQDWLEGHVEKIVHKGAYSRNDLVNEVKRLVGECVRHSSAEVGGEPSDASEPVMT